MRGLGGPGGAGRGILEIPRSPEAAFCTVLRADMHFHINFPKIFHMNISCLVRARDRQVSKSDPFTGLGL